MALIKRKPVWTQAEAVSLCIVLERIAPTYGAHVALTGGTLYKAFEGPRKDVDILFYRIRQVDNIDEGGLIRALEEQGFAMGARLGWVQKANFGGKHVDLFFPHYDGAEYEPTGIVGEGY
jgi:hypothetical protein